MRPNPPTTQHQTRPRAHFIPSSLETKNPLNLRVGRISLLSLYLQIRPSPGCVWVPKAKPIRVSVIIHARSVCPPSLHFNDYFAVRTERPSSSSRILNAGIRTTRQKIYRKGNNRYYHGL